MTISSSRYVQPTTNGDGLNGRRSPKPPPRIWNAIDPPFRGYQALPTDSYSQTSSNDPIIIDNGSHLIRAGYSTSSNPLLEFTADVARYKDRKTNRHVCYVGYNAFADATTRGQIKGPFQEATNVVEKWDYMENVLDYVFSSLGVDNGEGGGIGRGIVMTEPIAALGYTRKTMNEVLFECYRAPSVAYGIDALFSFKQNKGSDGIIISSSYTSTHVLPVLAGKAIMSGVSRLNFGGYHAALYLKKLLHLKYPGFPAQIKDYQVEQMVRDQCYVSQSFDHEIAHYLEWTGLEDRDHVIQFPFTEHTVIEKSKEELEQIAERKRQGGIRLQEQAAQMRLKKLIEKEQNLEFWKDLQRRLEGQTKKEVKRLLDAEELKDEAALDRTIKDLEKRIRKARNKDIGVEEPEEQEEQSFPLLDTPDADLDEAGLKQKRHQRLMKSGLEARQRAKAEKAQEAARQAEVQRLDDEQRDTNLDSWLQQRRAKRSTLLQQIKDRDRQTRDLGNRKSLASQIRMKTLASLASDQPGRKRRRGGGADDDFGANDEDWGVYRTVQTGEPGASDEEEEEDLDGDMRKLEAELLQHDPDFSEAHTMGAARDWTKSLMHAFLRGPRPFDPESQRELHQLHLNVERIRVPEVVFQPSIAGLDQAGLVDIAAGVIESGFGKEGRDRRAVLRDIFFTGGNTMFEGFQQRFEKDLRALLPVDAVMQTRKARDPLLDAWKGAANWAREPAYKTVSVSRAEYEEKGSEYMKEHNLGNVG